MIDKRYALINLWQIGHAGTNDTTQFGLCGGPHASNCSGAGNEVILGDRGSANVELIKRVNPPSGGYDTQQKMNWYCKDQEGYLCTSVEPDTMPWRWHAVGMGSKNPSVEGQYNQVRLIDERNGLFRIDAIQIDMTHDDLSPTTHPWLFHHVWVAGRRITDPIRESPKGPVIMPLFDDQPDGLWIKPMYLDHEIGGAVVPPPPPVRTITIPAGAKYYSAAGKIKKTDVYRFAWTAPILEATMIKLISWYRVATSEWVRGDFN